MRLMIVRHADPDYEHDSLTEEGWKEAKVLAERLSKLPAKDRGSIHAYVSILGRAKDTASFSLARLGIKAEPKPWLREFDAPIIDERTGEKRICWDFLPDVWTKENRYFDREEWGKVPQMADYDVMQKAKWVYEGLDAVLADHGYVREGKIYRADRANRDTVLLFCHLGVECVMLSHLFNCSPMLLWHYFSPAPSSVTTLYTEEREENRAVFRAASLGDISHLYAAGLEPSFAARFCETFDNMEERH